MTMSFLTRVGFLETPEQEQTRLASAPEGSISHALSHLPVVITEPLQDLLIQLPWAATDRTNARVVVVLIEFSPDIHPDGEDEPRPRRRHVGHWECAVVSSDHPSYPVGGHRLSISTAELVRGTRVIL